MPDLLDRVERAFPKPGAAPPPPPLPDVPLVTGGHGWRYAAVAILSAAAGAFAMWWM
jgi:ubiquinone biosynthesis protein